ncbi:MAG TPA: HAMP domain-containing sensor histidine kinase, partial [Chthoniobacterales bacterium]
FLDSNGAVITPPSSAEFGALQAEEEAQLALGSLPTKQQIGYLRRRQADGRETVDQVIAMPIVSTETGEVISALVLGLKPVELGSDHARTEITSGIWLDGRLHLPTVAEPDQAALAAEVGRAVAANSSESSFNVQLGGAPHLAFYKHLNPDSLFPPAYEVAVYPLADAFARQQQIRWHVLLAGGALLVGGFVASHVASGRLSVPVEELAVTSEENLAQRQRAEAALEFTSEELQRSARFSADASHQLKTPVTVLRAGIEELLAREGFTPETYDKLSALLHQTYRITGVVDDLLLLSRMDAGALRIQFETVNLSQLIEEWIDDLSALPDDLHVSLETDFPPDLHVTGEKRYISLIAQNLLENARKYNRPGGRICVSAKEDGELVRFSVGNTGRAIPAAARAHIFERFHRGGRGENIPGHGLGLNLARELARLHGGDLRLMRSEEDWTEFEVCFRWVVQPVMTAAQPA